MAKLEDFSGYHLSTKTGPTGKQALVSSLLELELIFQPKFESLRSSIYVLGGPELRQKMETCHANVALLQEVMR